MGCDIIKITDFLFKRKSFLCIFCDTHKPLYDADFHLSGLGMCKKCKSAIRTFPYTAMPVSTEHCRTVISVLPYDPIIRSSIKRFKFDNCPKYADIYGYLTNKYLDELNRGYSFRFTDMFDIIVPVPLSKERLCERGYNQSQLICKTISEYHHIPEYDNALLKLRDTAKQSLLEHKDRAENVRNAYKADSDIVSGKRILLFDDIMTTGSTADSCAAALYDAGAENVSILTLANRPVYMHRNMMYNELFR